MDLSLKYMLGKRVATVLVTAFLSVGACLAQPKVMGLQECITYALEHNPTILRAQNDFELSKINTQRNNLSAYPTINGFANNNFNFGRSIDPSTNQFANQTNRNNYFSIQMDYGIFTGLQRVNQQRQARWNQNASMENVQKVKDDIALNVANLYLQVLLAEEQLNTARSQRDGTKQTLDRIEVLFKNGGATEQSRLEILSQYATDESNVTVVENQLNTAYLALKQAMNYDLYQPLSAALISVPVDTGTMEWESYLFNSETINDQVTKMPAVKGAKNQMEASKYGIDIARSGLLPKLNMTANIFSVYSSLSKSYGFTQNGFSQIGIVGFDTSQKVYGPSIQTTIEDLSFSQQLERNLGQSVGLTLNVPIFNGFQSKFNIETAKNQYKSATMGLEQEMQKARNDMIIAFENTKMSKRKYQAAANRLKTQQLVFDNGNVLFERGAMNYFAWQSLKFNLQRASADLSSARYEYLFNIKVLEYYMGKGIRFE